jgi:hypothetical protein
MKVKLLGNSIIKAMILYMGSCYVYYRGLLSITGYSCMNAVYVC